MAYQTGTALSLNNLLDKLAQFAQPLGWQAAKPAENKLTLANTAGGWILELSAGLLYVRRSEYPTGNTATSELTGGNYISYDFFGTTDYLHVVVQYTTERFRHFGLGTLIKEGDYVGGQYCYGTYLNLRDAGYSGSGHVFGFSAGTEKYSAIVRADGLAGETISPCYFNIQYVSDFTGVRQSDRGKYLLGLGRAAMHENYATAHPDSLLVKHSQSTFGHTLIPCPHSLIAHCRDGVFRRLGIVPDRYECTMKGIHPRQQLDINGEKWMIIPSAQYDERVQRLIEGKENSGPQAVAYRIVE